MDAPSVRVVTPEQYSQGYLELQGMIARERRYSLIRKLEDGNLLVREPQAVTPPATRHTVQARLAR